MKTAESILVHHCSRAGVKDFSPASVDSKLAVDEAPSGRLIRPTPQGSHSDIPAVPWHVKENSALELRAISDRHFISFKIHSPKSGGCLTEDKTGQKMVALCR